MAQFVIKYGRLAIEDLQTSYDWGVENWGVRQANEWVSRIEEVIAKRLTWMPLACPLAPESEVYDFEIRQLVLHRYRILYGVENDFVYVLRVRGPFSDTNFEFE